MIRAIFFIDGFNVYHAVKSLKANHLKWLDFRKPCENFAPSPQFSIEKIYYFSAYATWLPDAYARHKVYVKALESVNVTPVLGKIKEKDRGCNLCNAAWKTHEEKETDVNIALTMLDEAYRDTFDRAIIISADSDFAPAIRLVMKRFPQKQFRVLTPTGRKHSWDLVDAAGGKDHAKHIKQIHLERSLFPETLIDLAGKVITRPVEYDPPT